MPLKLIERVLPWLVGSLTEDEATDFLRNMHLAGYARIPCSSLPGDNQYGTDVVIFTILLTCGKSSIQLRQQILLW